MTDIVDGIMSIVDGIKNVLVEVFIPSDDFLDNKINSLRERFSFADSIIGTANILFDFFKTQTFNTPPKLDINLKTANSKYDYGSSALALDMSWYTPYKPSVDIILSGFLWVVFIWNTFKDLAGIISGVGSTAVSTDIAMNRAENGGSK